MLEAIAKHGVTHLATAPTAYKAMLSQPALDDALKTLRYLPVGRRASARGDLARVEGAHRHRHHRRHRLDRDDAHLHLRERRRRSAPAQPARRCRATRRPCSTRTASRWTRATAASRSRARPAAATSMTRARRDYVVNGWNVTGDTYRRDADGYYLVPRAQRRHDRQLGLQYRRARSGECAPRPPRRRRMRGDRRALPRARAEGEGVHRPRRLRRAERRADRRSSRLSSRTTIAPYKYPREIEFVDALPKTATGKLRRSELRSCANDGVVIRLLAICERRFMLSLQESCRRQVDRPLSSFSRSPSAWPTIASWRPILDVDEALANRATQTPR